MFQNEAVNVSTHKRVIRMDVNEFIMNQIKTSRTGVFRCNKLFGKNAKAQWEGVQLLHFFTGLLHPHLQGRSKARQAQNSANIAATYIFSAIYAKILINKHIYSPILNNHYLLIINDYLL